MSATLVTGPTAPERPITYRRPEPLVSTVLFQTKADHAYYVLREQIAHGELPPGEPINQEELVVLAAHRDARVAPLSAEEARSLSEMRIPLESLAAGLAAERIDPVQREALRALADQLEPLGEHASEHALEVHRRFHAAIWEAAHNEPLTATLDLLWDRADRYRRQGLSEIRGTGATRKADFEQHFELRDLILAGEREAAVDLMRRHVELSLLSLGPAAVAEHRR
jgi:DNA-binding GntR family transcriptional regulator